MANYGNEGEINMKRVLFLFITIVFLSGCGYQTYTYEDASNSTSLFTTQQSNENASTVQVTEDTEETAETATAENAGLGSDIEEVTVYITKAGGKYHIDGCRYLSKSKIPISLSEAVSEGYGACSVCNPPALETTSTVTEEDKSMIAEDDKQAEQKEITVYVTKTGSKYHHAGCRYLSKSSIPISLSDAKSMYSPCSVCDPPH